MKARDGLPHAAMVKLDFRLVPDLTPVLVLSVRGVWTGDYTDIEIHPAAGMVATRCR